MESTEAVQDANEKINITIRNKTISNRGGKGGKRLKVFARSYPPNGGSKVGKPCIFREINSTSPELFLCYGLEEVCTHFMCRIFKQPNIGSEAMMVAFEVDLPI